MYKQDLSRRLFCSEDLNLSPAATAAKSLQSCLTLCDPRDGSPPRLPCAWDSPGKNTGVGCLFLLQCMQVKSESEVAPSCPTLSDPMNCSPPGSSIHGIFQARVLLGSNSFQFITGELMLLFIIPLPNLEKRNFGAKADKQPT